MDAYIYFFNNTIVKEYERDETIEDSYIQMMTKYTKAIDSFTKSLKEIYNSSKNYEDRTSSKMLNNLRSFIGENMKQYDCLSSIIKEDILSELEKNRKIHKEMDFKLNKEVQNKKSLYETNEKQFFIYKKKYNCIRYLKQLKDKNIISRDYPYVGINPHLLTGSSQQSENLTLEKFIDYKTLMSNYTLCEESWIKLRETESTMQQLLSKVIQKKQEISNDRSSQITNSLKKFIIHHSSFVANNQYTLSIYLSIFDEHQTLPMTNDSLVNHLKEIARLPPKRPLPIPPLIISNSSANSLQPTIHEIKYSENSLQGTPKCVKDSFDSVGPTESPKSTMIIISYEVLTLVLGLFIEEINTTISISFLLSIVLGVINGFISFYKYLYGTFWLGVSNGFFLAWVLNDFIFSYFIQNYILTAFFIVLCSSACIFLQFLNSEIIKLTMFSVFGTFLTVMSLGFFFGHCLLICIHYSLYIRIYLLIFYSPYSFYLPSSIRRNHSTLEYLAPSSSRSQLSSFSFGHFSFRTHLPSLFPYFAGIQHIELQECDSRGNIFSLNHSPFYIDSSIFDSDEEDSNGPYRPVEPGLLGLYRKKQEVQQEESSVTINIPRLSSNNSVASTSTTTTTTATSYISANQPLKIGHHPMGSTSSLPPHSKPSLVSVLSPPHSIPNPLTIDTYNTIGSDKCPTTTSNGRKRYKSLFEQEVLSDN
ncbi:hypothetical protein WA158_000979 [Blastocystis sp. Blastoise]